MALPPHPDVCIVGAGPGGLAAALAVKRAAPRLRVTVVERASALAPRGALVAVVPNVRVGGERMVSGRRDRQIDHHHRF